MSRIRRASYVFFLSGLWLLLVLSTYPPEARAFEAVTWEDGKSADVYGFVRNNLGMFTQTQEQGGSGNQLATARTWLRTYGDFKLSKQFRVWVATQFVYEPWYPVEDGNPVSEHGGTQQHNRSGWKTYSEYNDVNDVIREDYVEWKINKRNAIKIGRQIAIWGEALTDRVGDVIHPNDSRFAFAFSNLEDTRIPQYMIRGYHEIKSLSSSFEWIFDPPVVAGEYTVNRSPYPGNPGQRFAVHSDDRNPYDPTRPGYDPTLPHAPLFTAGGRAREIYPSEFSDTRFGFRTSTFIHGWQFGVSYFHTQNYSPLPSRDATIAELSYVHPQINVFGVTINKQLPTGIVRAEGIYVPDMPFATFDVGPDESGTVRRERVKYLVAYDLNGFFNFQWHKTAPFNVTIEHIGEWVPDSRELQYFPYYTRFPNYSGGLSVNINTTWFYGKLSTDLTMGYNTFGDAGLFMPSAKWTPSWQNQRFSAELKYIGIYGDSSYEGLGTLKNKDMLLLTTQFNF